MKWGLPGMGGTSALQCPLCLVLTCTAWEEIWSPETRPIQDMYALGPNVNWIWSPGQSWQVCCLVMVVQYQKNPRGLLRPAFSNSALRLVTSRRQLETTPIHKTWVALPASPRTTQLVKTPKCKMLWTSATSQSEQSKCHLSLSTLLDLAGRFLNSYM